MSVPKNVRPARLLNTRYFRRVEARKQLRQARQVLRLVNTNRPKLALAVVGLVGALISLGAAGAVLARHWIR